MALVLIKSRHGLGEPPGGFRRREREQSGPYALLAMLLTHAVCAGCAAERGTVGVRFVRDPAGHLYARDVPVGLGASDAGMRPGDQVLLIEGRDVRPMSDDELHAILSGECGSTVRLTVLRHDEAMRFAVKRTRIPKAMSQK